MWTHALPLCDYAVQGEYTVPMHIASALIGLLWLSFFVYWLVSAATAKRTIRGPYWWRAAAIRLTIVIIVYFLVKHPSLIHHLGGIGQRSHTTSLVRDSGIVLCAIGLAFAVWARRHIGKNWGMPMTSKEHPELVTTGPYALVRHPIYSGILLALLGSSLTTGVFDLALLVIFGVYFLYCAYVEEALMSKEFPDRYPEYKKRTKFLIPFVL